MNTRFAARPADVLLPPEDPHRYNDDLLLLRESVQRAAVEFPGVLHILHHKEMAEAFAGEDSAADSAKRRSQAAGFWALLCALASLMAGSSEPAWEDLDRPWPAVIAVCAAVLGLTAAAIAWLGLLYGRQKSAWLHRRLFTERLRQFHFQTFIWRLKEISLSLASPDGPAQFRAARDEWFAGFQSRFKAGRLGVELAAVLDPTIVPQVWIHENASRRHPTVPEDIRLTELFRAYRKFRFDEQFYYATHMLRAMNAPRPFSAMRVSLSRWLLFPFAGWPLKTQQAFLGSIWVTAFIALVMLHVIVVVYHLSDSGSFSTVWLNVGVIWLALIAISAKTLAEGLGLSRELERYQEYRAIVGELLVRFDPDGDPQECVEQMIELERASFEEMRSFLRTHSECTFVL